MNDRIRELYIDHVLERAEAGILDHALTNAVDAGLTVDEAMTQALRAAGRLPTEGLEKARQLHVVPHRGRWAVKRDGSQEATEVVSTQREAIQVAKRIARGQGTDVVIHGRDGKIRHTDGHSNDLP